MSIEIRQITKEDARGFWECLDGVARERRYLIFLEAPPFEKTEDFVRENVLCPVGAASGRGSDAAAAGSSSA